MMTISKKISIHNFKSFLWHATFLALAQSFMDVDTIIPAMLYEAGGEARHIGLMTAIMLGGSSFSQLFFAPYISNRSYKKGVILTGINLRIFSLLALGSILFYLSKNAGGQVLFIIFIFITLFALSGAFANIAYMDILGKSINSEKRKQFLSSRQIISGIAILFSGILARQIIELKSYPINYAYSFFIGGLLILIASLGFWRIKETIKSDLKIGNIKHFLSIMQQEIKENKKLIYFLGFINTQGIAISFLPFIVYIAKAQFNAQKSDTGNFLIFKIIGLVLVSLLVLLSSKRLRYNRILYTNVILSVSMAIFVFFINELSTLKYVFLMGGIIFSLYTISMNGVLLEISGTQKRSLYAGFAGAGNILPALFPLTGGWLIEQLGIKIFLILFATIVSFSIFFIYKINCSK